VPIEEVRLAQRDTDNTEQDLGNVDLGRWQPDFILVCVVTWKRKRIAEVNLTLSADMLTARLAEVYRSKKRKIQPCQISLTPLHP
jgi:hypothetical protein